MTLDTYKPAFVYFGGKSTVADPVWDAIGADVACYVEPFFGTGAVLFLRPDAPGKRIETVNDADGFICNFWRATQRDSDAVAEYADWPVNEADLHARHLWLLGQRERITERLMGDPEFFDAKVAGWWVHGINCWIGGGWCSGNGPWVSENGVLVRRDGDGEGVNRTRPHLGDAGRGVNRTTHDGESRREYLKRYLAEFRERLARVRVCCGDWSRVCGPSVTFKHGTCGVFLDPPYADTAKRADGLYAIDCQKVAHDVREWAIRIGQRKDMRIVLAGYDGEHQMPADWRVVAWKARGGMANQGNNRGRENAKRERLWMSPHCLAEESPLFGRSEDKGVT